MNLNHITANIRLRSPWEAVDLGFVMVQAWWKSIYLPLIIVTLGIAIPMFYLLPEKDYWIGATVIWWLKPLYDRLVLHIISQKLFNQELSTKQALQALPSLMWNTGFFQAITFRRLSLSRGFNLPIWQLEQLRGKKRAERQNLLHLTTHSQAVWSTIGCWLIEVIMLLSLFILLLMFLPSEIASDFIEGVFTNNLEYKRWIDILNSFFYVAVVTLVHPFYIAGSFALYINRRTELEAWDIELDFKKIGLRLESIANNKIIGSKNSLPAILFIAAVAFSTLQTYPVMAEEAVEILAPERKTVEHSRSVIDEVMLTKNLNDKRKETKWVKIKQEKKKDKKKDKTDMSWLKNILESFGQLFAIIFEYALWIAIAVGLYFIFRYRDNWLYLFQGGKKKKEDDYIAPEVMFGMDVRPESLPDDIISNAKQLWDQGKHREALSLLYRGALVRLINQEHIQLQNSHTEGDVLKHSALKLNSGINLEKLEYLNVLTDQWRTIAYAHRAPDETLMQNLFSNWHSKFAVDAPSIEDAEVNNKGGDNE